LLALLGLDGCAQVDLGARSHRHQNNEALGRMAGQIMLTVLARLESQGIVSLAAPPATLLAQFRCRDDIVGLGRDVVVTDIAVQERPPLADLLAARPGLAIAR
jgi:glucosyl-3-phosphoglycerate synthase